VVVVVESGVVIAGWLAGWLLGGGARGVGIGRVRDRQVDSNARVSSR
jgi:hypothetical protein